MDESVTSALAAAEQWLWYGAYIGLLILLIQLFRNGLWRIYRWFTAYLAVELVQGAVLLSVEPGTNRYAWFYFGFIPAIGIASVLAVLEIHDLVLRKYTGIGSLGRWVIYGGLTVSLIVAAVSLYPDLSGSDLYPKLRYVIVFQRALDSALLIFLALIAAFVMWFPVPLARNVVVHSLVFGAFFGTHALAFLVRNVFGAGTADIVGVISMTVFIGCAAAWLRFLRPEGETVQVVYGHRWNPEESKRLSGQLDAINQTLLRTARK